MPASFAVSSTAPVRSPANQAGVPQPVQVGRAGSFEIYRAELVSLTSTLFSGGDWRWRFRSAAGAVLVKSEGYSSERACRVAVQTLQAGAGSARVAEPSWC